MRCEFTCWDDSLRTDWADPARPAEVIEIGLAFYRVASRAVTSRFSRLVRPVMNPKLSPYCVELLRIAQVDIDAAEELPGALQHVETWLTAVDPDLSTCGWGANDRRRLARNAATRGANDPLAGRPHIDLRDVMTALRRHPRPIGRDELRALASLPANPGRHRALDDALDLAHFLGLLLT